MIRIATLLAAFAIVLTLGVASMAQVRSEAELWAAVGRGEAVVLMRHALAPGTGDPRPVVIGDCTSQRNLSEEGRAQARAIGQRFRENGIAAASVFTSQWCRCRETAALLGLGEATDLPALNSFFVDREKGPAQTEALTRWLARERPSGPVVLVTHQVNITALAGVVPPSGGMVVAALDDAGNVRVLGEL